MMEFDYQKQHDNNDTATVHKSRTSTRQRQSVSAYLKNSWREWQSLDSDNYGSWPIAVKVIVVTSLLLIISVTGYVLPIRQQLANGQVAEDQQHILLETYRKKEAEVRHLQTYRSQAQHIEAQLQQQMQQLPEDSQMSELMIGIDQSGVTSGIQFQDIAIEPEIEQDAFFEQPIRLVAIGDYHQFGVFMSKLAALPRIVTLHDFEVRNAEVLSQQMTPINASTNTSRLMLILHIKAYRSKASDSSIKQPIPSEDQSMVATDSPPESGHALDKGQESQP